MKKSRKNIRKTGGNTVNNCFMHIVLKTIWQEKTDDFLRVFKKNEDIWVCSYRKVKILKESKNE